MNILKLQKMKTKGEKITMVTCYDHWTAKLIASTDVDCVLVGDSAAMVMHGYDSTVHATIEMMVMHTKAVARAIDSQLVVGDLPFLSYRKGLPATMDAVAQLMQAGAQAVKLEGVAGNEALIEHVVQSGVPVMGHIGMTPQSIHQLGGFRVQGKDQVAVARLIEQAVSLEQAGCFAVVLECVPPEVAEQITAEVGIPTIGIGAGPATDGQVLVLQDLMGADPDFVPKFLKQYGNAESWFQQALTDFNSEVKTQKFPQPEHCYEASS